MIRGLFCHRPRKTPILNETVKIPRSYLRPCSGSAAHTTQPLPLGSAAGSAPASAILDLPQKSIVTEIKDQRDLTRVIKLDTRLRLSHFLQAVFLGDYPGALATLAQFRSQCLRQTAQPRNLHLYTTCFLTLLSQAVRNDRPVVSTKHAWAILNAVRGLPKALGADFSGAVSEIQCLSIVVLLRVLEGTPQSNKIARVDTVAWIRTQKTKYALSEATILSKIRSSAPHLVPQYNQAFQQNEPAPQQDEEYVRLETALDSLRGRNNALSFDALCRFVESEKFDASSFISQGSTKASQTTKYYEVAESLEEPQKEAFMEAYLAFNYRKQLLVEDASQNVYKSVSPSSRMMGFSSLHRAWLTAWISAATEAVEGANLDKYAFVFDHLPADHIISLCLTHMLSATIPAPQTKVLPLALNIGRSLRKELGYSDKVAASVGAHKLAFSSDHALELACSVMDILIHSCELPALKRAKKQAESYNSEEPDSNKVFQSLHVKEDGDTKYAMHGAIKIHPAIAEHFKIYEELFHTGAYRLPMVHPPKQWTSPQDGGFFSIPLSLVKSSEPHTSDMYMEKAHKTGQLSSVYHSVNALGACPWTVNPRTLDTFNRLMIASQRTPTQVKGMPLALTPQLEKNTEMPNRANYGDTKAYLSDLARWKKINSDNTQKAKAAHSLWIYYTMVNRLANSFAKHGEIMFLPHNMDFRGRVYPAVSFLSHQNEDLVRSLLMFWDAKPLGPHGYGWLQYQMANLYNKQKMSMEQSQEFVECHRKEITQSANDPTAEGSWWLQGDNPWQVLALCHEFAAIWKHPGDISNYKSRIPVHQDGSCNGLQHYSALGADEAAARAVNVLPDEKMHDVYTTVLDLVKAQVERDRVSGSKSAAEVATSAQKVLSRKLVKQTVMTTVYGVTPYGARQQVRNRIDELCDESGVKGDTGCLISEAERHKIAAYVAHQVLQSIADLFAGARLIQNWLVENCARCIQAFNPQDFPEGEAIDFFAPKHYRPMMWTSLSGFPVIQMYRKRAFRELRTPLQRLILSDDSKLAVIDEAKSKNGIAPNFIHSVDAIHLLMTSLGAKIEGITFASVHDSFWTHASEVNALSRIIREEFARLHSSDITGHLRRDLVHVNRNGFQLVWVSKAGDPEFVAELEAMRKAYIKGTSVLSKEKVNTCLQREFRDNSKILAMLNTFEPTLLWQSTISSSVVVYDDSGVLKEVEAKISVKTHVPILAPVRIMEAPAVGSLNIHSVKDSKYFFS